MGIPMPSQDERRNSIEAILKSIPEKPLPFSEALCKTVRRLGWRGLFFGIGDAAFIALIASVIIGAVFV